MRIVIVHHSPPNLGLEEAAKVRYIDAMWGQPLILWKSC